jgi:hypothetical protein
MTPSDPSWRETAALATFGLSLTAVTATGLFVLVGFNPKVEAYGNLPWYYAAGCAVLSAVLYLVSRRLGRPGRRGRPAEQSRNGAAPDVLREGDP